MALDDNCLGIFAKAFCCANRGCWINGSNILAACLLAAYIHFVYLHGEYRQCMEGSGVRFYFYWLCLQKLCYYPWKNISLEMLVPVLIEENTTLKLCHQKAGDVLEKDASLCFKYLLLLLRFSAVSFILFWISYLTLIYIDQFPWITNLSSATHQIKSLFT